MGNLTRSPYMAEQLPRPASQRTGPESGGPSPWIAGAGILLALVAVLVLWRRRGR
jgi:LPXTG-motif cell wall-anchored protein